MIFLNDRVVYLISLQTGSLVLLSMWSATLHSYIISRPTGLNESIASPLRMLSLSTGKPGVSGLSPFFRPVNTGKPDRYSIVRSPRSEERRGGTEWRGRW